MAGNSAGNVITLRLNLDELQLIYDLDANGLDFFETVQDGLYLKLQVKKGIIGVTLHKATPEEIERLGNNVSDD